MTEDFKIKSIFLMNDEPVRKLENLNLYKNYWAGSKEKPEVVCFSENDIQYEFSPSNCQKTGHFFDQSENRTILSRLVKDKKVADLFSFNGSFALNAIKNGAKSVVAIDNSLNSVSMIERNAAINGFDNQVKAVKMNLLRTPELDKDGFDVVILDPPALIKNKKSFHQGYAAYLKLNRDIIKIIRNNGWLVSCSCSYHLKEDQFVEMLMKAGQKSQKRLQLIELRSQARDHPVLPAMPETKYLKCALLKIT